MCSILSMPELTALEKLGQKFKLIKILIVTLTSQCFFYIDLFRGQPSPNLTPKERYGSCSQQD